ncbi:MAG: hypothetical protein LLF76_11000 [Planctomycetaceae bacterium]|nr:hypothetical protein [Planctomycetaceae bacterium]
MSTVLKAAFLGSLAGFSSTFVYIVIGLAFNNTPIDFILYRVSIAFAWPFGFLLPLLEEMSKSYVGTIFGFLIASSLGGLLYGALVGALIYLIRTARGFLQRAKNTKLHSEP